MDDAPKKLWLLWREGGYVKGRVVASEVDHDDEGFPSYVPTADLERVRREARVEGMRALLAVGNGAAACYPDQYGDVWGAASHAMAEFIETERGTP